jgi:hypothetical protein
MTMKHLLLALAAVALCACAMPQGAAKGGNPWAGLGAKRTMAAQQPAAPSYVDEVIDVVTEPPGARILVNEAPVGTSPLRYSVRRLWRGQPGYMALDTVKVEALPTAAGQCVQTGIYGQGATKVPAPVSFNMTSCAPAQK